MVDKNDSIAQIWQKTLANSGFYDVENAPTTSFRSLGRTNSAIPSSFRWFTHEKAAYYQRLYEFNRHFNFKRRFKSNWKLIKHITRLTAKGLTSTQVQKKVNKILNVRFHRDSYSRLIRTSIEPAMMRWWRHNYWSEQMDPGLLGVRPPDLRWRPGRSRQFYAALVVAQKNMARSNINELKASKPLNLP